MIIVRCPNCVLMAAAIRRCRRPASWNHSGMNGGRKNPGRKTSRNECKCSVMHYLIVCNEELIAGW